jgi:catechol 2,3-dioxygenase-like lactoylglutathione lyase family enzyme
MTTTTRISTEQATESRRGPTIAMMLEVVVIPVSDMDRAKAFYVGLGWRVDADLITGDGSRAVQLTPPGSPASIHLQQRNHDAPGGTSAGTWLIVFDIDAARAELAGRDVEVSSVFHFAPGQKAPVPGRDPEGRSYASFASFNDPDGNNWLLQEVTTRLPGRGYSMGVESLTMLLREAEERHGQYQATAPKHHWSGWYAGYIAAREHGRTPDDAEKDAALHMESVRR